jgi:mannose-6-phosphate isomerase-like protein (cupin superfamily)
LDGNFVTGDPVPVSMNVARFLSDEGHSATVEKQDLTEELDTSNVALNHYTIPADEGLPGGLHAHLDQEEVFVVLDGVAVFETFEGTETVEAGDAIRFQPGEFQSGRNSGDSALQILAIGAPKETEEVRIPAVCPACGQNSLELDFAGESLTFHCPSCDAQHVPSACPSCGNQDLEIGLEDGTSETIVVCQACGTRYDEPPLQ